MLLFGPNQLPRPPRNHHPHTAFTSPPPASQLLFPIHRKPLSQFLLAAYAATMSSDLVLPYGHGQALAVWDTSVKHVEELTLPDSEDESGVPGISPRGTTSSS